MDTKSVILRTVELADIKTGDDYSWPIEHISSNLVAVSSLLEAFRDYANLRGDPDIADKLEDLIFIL